MKSSLLWSIFNSTYMWDYRLREKNSEGPRKRDMESGGFGRFSRGVQILRPARHLQAAQIGEPDSRAVLFETRVIGSVHVGLQSTPSVDGRALRPFTGRILKSSSGST